MCSSDLATPDRADSLDIHGLFDDFVAFRAGIERGVSIGRLVPFRYFGLTDDIDYANIPWRNHRFDADQLAAAAATESRMQSLWKGWGEHPGTRTLVFCCSVAHARYVKQWLTRKGVRVAAVYAEPDSDDRAASLEQLGRNELDAVCAVDTELHLATRVGTPVKDVFRQGVAAYDAVGFADEWHLHHQGGPCGYQGRDYLGSPSAPGVVLENQPFAWNPSITGTKSEDTILATSQGVQVITPAQDWPMISVEGEDGAWQRPEIGRAHV